MMTRECGYMKKRKEKHVLEVYEEAFCESELTKMREGKLLDRAIAGYRVKSIWSGSVLEVEAYPYWHIPQGKRIKQDKNSTKAQAKLNEKNRQKHVARLLNTNFRAGDLYMTLTYGDSYIPTDYEQAKKDMQNMIRRMKRWLKKQEQYADFELKYLYVTEHTRNGEKVRVHHHMVTNFPNREVAEDLWRSKGRVKSERLYDGDLGFTELGKYLVKEKGEKTAKGYTPSRNLKPHTKVSSSDTKLTRRRAAKIATEEIGAQEIFEKMYKNYQFKDMQVMFSDYVSGAYLYVRMKRIENYTKKGRTTYDNEDDQHH